MNLDFSSVKYHIVCYDSAWFGLNVYFEINDAIVGYMYCDK